MVPVLFGEIRERYLERPGGYTRVVRIESEKEDQAESAILELVDGPKDIRFALTAKTLARMKDSPGGVMKMNELTARNVEKVTRYRKDGMESLVDMVDRMRKLNVKQEKRPRTYAKQKVYPVEDWQKNIGFADY